MSFEGHTAGIRVLRTFNDGVRFVSGSEDKSIKSWDIGSKSCLSTLIGHENIISDLVIYDEKRVVSGDKSAKLKVWDIETGKVVQDIDTQKGDERDIGEVMSIALKADKTVLTTHVDDPVLKFWSNM